MAGSYSTAAGGTETLAEFCEALRELRRAAGEPGYRVLARRTGYASTTLWEATSGRAVPTRPVTLAFVSACGGDTAEWERRWRRLVEAHRPPTPAAVDAGPSPAPTAAAGRRGVPRQLPTDVYGFTGRTVELARLDELMTEALREGVPGVVISAVSGTAGVGKTALAVHWAHRVADRFPDGQLYVDLRGYDPEQPTGPADALAEALRALGVDGGDIPGELDERAARYRTLLSGRRMLVVLDNAGTVEQVRPLLPGGGTCFVVVTSRDSLTGLVVRHGARRIDLDALSVPDGIALLRTLVGERVDAEPDEAVALVERCVGLPLALRIAAELAVSRPAAPLAKLVAELADERGRLDVLELGADDRTAVRVVFSWSYRQLPAPAARAFRLLGLCPGPDVDRYAAAALFGLDLGGAGQALDALVRAHLIQPTGSGRYRMHDLLRAYAAERAETEDPAAEGRAGLTRLLHFYHATLDAAMRLLFPAEHRHRPRVNPLPNLSVPLESAGSAQAWLDAERTNLVEAIGYAADHGWPTQAGYLTHALWRYLDFGAHYDDARAVYVHALRAAVEHDDQLGEALARQGLGHAFYRFNDYETAADQYRRAAENFAAIGDERRQNLAVTNLGMVYTQWGRYADALPCYERGVEVARTAGDRAGEALALAWAGLELGRLARYDEGIDNLRRALAYFREVAFPMREAEVITDLGLVHLWAGRPDEASALLRQALAIGRATGDRNREVEALNGLGEVYRATGQLTEAFASHESALALAREIGQRDEQARALDGMAGARWSAGDLDAARRHWEQAVDLYTALRMPLADEVRTRLAEVTGPR
jgi:tetratricopeptide (TPR) repeat protein